mmetsp:Transcript_70547/g.153238  ORF Transcript_70547/g.153238 Transcript_70547/m.153238 type:complete len:314 (+) Transcript_70547:84-1025(+)
MQACYVLFVTVLMQLPHDILGQGLSMSDILRASDPPLVEIITNAAGLRTLEGPVWVPARRALIFSDLGNRQMLEFRRGNLNAVRVNWGGNGNVLDLGGSVLTANSNAGVGGVTRVSNDGGDPLTILADSFEGRKFNNPNDVAVKSDGSIWFTDPNYGAAVRRNQEQDGQYVYRRGPDGTVTAVVTDGDKPNGIGFSPDESRLYFTDANPSRLRAFDVLGDGDRVSATPAWEAEVGLADGLTVDTEGNVYVAGRDGIHVFNKDGRKYGVIAVPKRTRNVCFGGRRYNQLFITAGNSVYRLPIAKTGHKPSGAEW